MKKLLVLLAVLTSSLSLHAQVSFLTTSQLKVEVLDAKVVHQIPVLVTRDGSDNRSEDNMVDVLRYAELELSLKITDEGCQLKEDSSLVADYKGPSFFSRGSGEDRIVNFYLTQKEAVDSGCTFSSKVEKIESIILPLVNGSSRESLKEQTIVYLVNKNQESPISVVVKINQLESKVEIK